MEKNLMIIMQYKANPEEEQKILIMIIKVK